MKKSTLLATSVIILINFWIVYDVKGFYDENERTYCCCGFGDDFYY